MTEVFRFSRNEQGLWLQGREEDMPQDSWRRFEGVSPLSSTSIQSRYGSTSVEALAGVHSLFRFNDTNFQGATTIFYQSGVSQKTGLDGTRLTMVAMPPSTGAEDVLYVAGGGDLFKIDKSSTISQWGIDAPMSTFAVAAGAAGNLNGDYIYRVTFANSTDGTRSNPNNTDVTITVTNQKVDLSGIPTSSDTQVDSREIWRTVAGQSDLFLVATISDNVTTTFEDNVADEDLQAIALQFDNDPPEDTYEDCEGPHDNRMLWCRDTASGKKGRVYYSPQGRPEAVLGFIDVTNEDDPTQKNVSWNGTWYVFTESHLFQIDGGGSSDIFTPRKVRNVLGTSNPHSVVKTNNGIIYQASDGIRIFDGVDSQRLRPEAIEGIFRGQTVEGISDFDGIVGAFGNDEYIISDTAQTLSYDFTRQRWRNLGVGLNAIHYSNDNSKFLASLNNEVVHFEDEMTVSDNGSAIPFEIQTPAIYSGPHRKGYVKKVTVDIDAAGQTITPTIIVDDVETTLPTMSGSTRERVELGVGLEGFKASFRLSGSITAAVEVFEIAVEAYIPQESET